MSIDARLSSRENNISLLRFPAAILVILSHAWPLSGNGQDWLQQRTGGQLSLGYLGVMVFFFFGGFLIMKSTERNSGAGAFFRARCKRIFPPLWIVVGLSVLVLGPLMTTLPLGAYFTGFGTWKYLLNGALIPVHELPGVFENNPYGPTVNGSLWTLPVEFLCYVFCWCFVRLGWAKQKKALPAAGLLALAAAAAALAVPAELAVLRSAIRACLFFLIGMVCYLYREKIPRNGILCAAAAILTVVSVPLGVSAYTVYLTVPCLLLCLAFGGVTGISRFFNRHEVSYGIYLTAFPIQQIIARFFPALSPGVHFLVCTPLAVLAGVLVTAAEKKWMKRYSQRKR